VRMTDEEPQGGVLKLQGRSISRGIASGKALISQHRISFLGGVDPLTGIIVDQSVDIYGTCIANRVLIFPGGKGSTVGSYVIYQLKQHGKAPAAMVTRSAGTIVAAGAIIAEIPVVDSLERDPIEGDLITDGMEVLVNGDKGYIEVH
jgi:predicted aconitase with swiveling domain